MQSCSQLAHFLLPQPAEAVDRGCGRDVLEPDVARVAIGFDGADVTLKVEGAGAGFAASGVVGDLHVGDPVGVCT